jgi:hypothetical protein
MTYPELTPYQFASNNPIGKIEIEGLEGVAVIEYVDQNGELLGGGGIDYECNGCKGKGEGGIYKAKIQIMNDGTQKILSEQFLEEHKVNASDPNKVVQTPMPESNKPKEKEYLCHGCDGPVGWILDNITGSEDAINSLKSWEGTTLRDGPFDAGGLNANASLSIGSGFSIDVKAEALDYGGESMEGSVSYSLNWSVTGGKTGASAGMTGYWKNPKYDPKVRVVKEGGIKYSFIYATAGNHDLDIQIGLYQKSGAKAFLEGYLGKDLKWGVLMDFGFSIDITNELDDGTISDDEWDGIFQDVMKGFEKVINELK